MISARIIGGLLLYNRANYALITIRSIASIKSAFAMDIAYFRHVPGEKDFHVSFRFKNTPLGVDKQFNFCRSVDESCSVFINRVSGNIKKLVEKKLRKKKELQVPEIKSALLCNGSPVRDDSMCQEIFEKPQNYELSILESQWKIAVNAPWIDSITLPKVIMVGFPVFYCKSVTYFMDPKKSVWTWHRSTANGGPWTVCGQGLGYIPNASDIGQYLRLVCVPRSCDGSREGPPAEAISPTAVEAGPGVLPSETRHNFTSNKVDNSGFRVISYNILADMYVDSELARTHLFVHCPPYALDVDYRKLLLTKELMGYNADIICLQEVDSKLFRHGLTTILSSVGMDGKYSQKGSGTVSEGTAIFYAKDKFRSIRSWRVVLSEHMSSWSSFSSIWHSIKGNEALASRLAQRSTTLQVVLLESLTNPGQMLLVANTHLYFHPDADHIRLLQAVLITIYLSELLEKIQKEHKNCKISTMLCGDFNSTPECGVYHLLTTGNVESDNLDWRSNINEAITDVSYSHSLKMASACGTPDFTNYTPGFKACIDYIFYQTDHLHIKQVVPFPSEEELSVSGGLPSIVFPSDHIALVTDIHWK